MDANVKFERRHFEWMAEWVYNFRPQEDRETVALELARALASTNPNFDRGKFLAACGVASAS